MPQYSREKLLDGLRQAREAGDDVAVAKFEKLLGQGSQPTADPKRGKNILQDLLGATDATLSGLGQGVSLGTSDEIAGALIPGMTREDFRAGNERAREEYPLAYKTSEAVGGFLPTLGAAAGIAARGGRAAVPSLKKLFGIGGAEGTVAGVGYGNAETPEEMAVDAVQGGALGTAAAGAGVGLQNVGRMVGNTIRRARNPNVRVAERVEEATGGMTPDEIRAELQASPDMRVADINPRTRKELGKAAKGEKRLEVQDTLGKRDLAATERVSESRKKLDLPSREERFATLRDVDRREVEVAYNTAYEELDPVINLYDESIENLSKRPAYRKAAEEAQEELGNRYQVIDDPAERRRLALKIARDKHTGRDGVMRINGNEVDMANLDDKSAEYLARETSKVLDSVSDGELLAVSHPTEFLNTVTKKLRGFAESGQRHDPSGSEAIGRIRSDVIAAIDDMAGPDNAFRSARRMHQERVLTQDALDVGRTLFTKSNVNDVFTVIRDGGYLDVPGAREALKVSIFDGLENAVAGGLTRKKFNKIIGTKRNIETLKDVLGDDGYARFKQTADAEIRMSATSRSLAQSEAIPEQFPSQLARAVSTLPFVGGGRQGMATAAAQGVTGGRRAGQTNALADALMSTEQDFHLLEPLLRQSRQPSAFARTLTAGGAPLAHPYVMDENR